MRAVWAGQMGRAKNSLQNSAGFGGFLGQSFLKGKTPREECPTNSIGIHRTFYGPSRTADPSIKDVGGKPGLGTGEPRGGTQ